MTAVSSIMYYHGLLFSRIVKQLLEEGFLPVLEMCTVAFVGGYLGGKKTDNLKKTLRRNLVTISNVSFWTNDVVGIKALGGFMGMKSQSLLWDPLNHGEKIHDNGMRLDRCRYACRILFSAILNLVKKFGIVSNECVYYITYIHIKPISIALLTHTIIS